MSTGGKVPRRFERLPPPPALTSVHFSDYQGRSAHRLWYPLRAIPTETDERDAAPPFAFQVYVPADIKEIAAKRQEIADYLFGPFGGALTTMSACIEVYPASGTDVFLSIAHQRREIAYRAQKDSRRRIPRYRRSSTDGPHGYLVLVSPHMLQTGANITGGSTLVTFNRHENLAAMAEARHPLGNAEDEGFSDASSSDILELLEVSCYRCGEPNTIAQTLIMLANASGAEDGADYAYEPRDSGVDQPVLMSLTPGAFRNTSELEVDVVIRHDGAGRPYVDLIRLSKTTEMPDMRYIIYIPASVSEKSETDLTAAGCMFLAALRPYWPASLTFHLSICAGPATTAEPDISTLGTILEHLAVEHAADGSLSTGYLLGSDSVGARDGAVRRVPGSVIAAVEARRRFREFDRFAVVLERAVDREESRDLHKGRAEAGGGRFGVLFVLDGMRQWQVEMGIVSETQSGVEIMVRRPTGIRALARRLAGLD